MSRRTLASGFLHRGGLAALLVAGPAIATAQDRSGPGTPGVTVLIGIGNDFGWLGLDVAAYLNPRLALFAGLGYTPAADPGDPEGLTVAGGVRGFTPGLRHRGFLEIGVTQVAVETSLTPLAGVRGRRIYGLGAQGGYQFVSRGGFTGLLSTGLGYCLREPVTGSRFQVLFGLGVGHTFRAGR
jgi:hypothetical protein